MGILTVTLCKCVHINSHEYTAREWQHLFGHVLIMNHLPSMLKNDLFTQMCMNALTQLGSSYQYFISQHY